MSLPISLQTKGGLMGYYVRALKSKIKNPNWKVQFITYKEHRKEWDISRDRWDSLGFTPSMTIEQATARAKQLNAQAEKKRQEAQRKKLESQESLLTKKITATIPEIYKTEFETKFFHERIQTPGWKKRFQTSWRASQRMLTEVCLDPIDWYENAPLFYDYFFRKRFSFSYIKKILLVTNFWGQFLARRLGQSFIKIPIPRGSEKSRLLEAYFSKCGTPYNQSDPITPTQLETMKSCLKPEHYNWIYLSVWLGLRPQEVDQLKLDNYVRLQPGFDGTMILWVYQTKLVSVPPRYRWKLIPIIFKEQKLALDIIQSKIFQRPLVKTVKRYFGVNTTLYGGRKGFSDLMLSQKQEFIHISQWMGHSSIERTWRNYKSRLITHYVRIDTKKTA